MGRWHLRPKNYGEVPAAHRQGKQQAVFLFSAALRQTREIARLAARARRIGQAIAGRRPGDHAVPRRGRMPRPACSVPEGMPPPAA